MIAPTKHVPVDRSLLAVGARILEALNNPRSANQLWQELRDHQAVVSYDQFTLGLAMLYAIGAVEEQDGTLRAARS